MNQRPWTYNPRLGDVIDASVNEEARNGWLMRHHLTTEARAKALRAVFFDGQPRWRSAFGVMLALAAGVATFGLSQDSAATVIGSMIIAPLGQPIVALGAALAMAWGRQILRLLGIITIGTAAVIGIAYALGMLLPDATPNGQILARTAPDLRDLGVAIFAGAAGAYAYTRDELSGVLPGVAIAVALVPPLATVGLMMEESRWTLASGAVTLFLTNLTGISLAAGVVMLVTRFAPFPRLKSHAPGVVAGVIASVATAALVAVPLAATYARVAANAAIATDVHTALNSVVGPTDPTVQAVEITGSNATVRLSDPTGVDATQIEDAVRSVLGPNSIVTVGN